MEIKYKVEKIILELINKTKEDIGSMEGKHLFEDLKFDSITIMQLIINVEEEFCIDLGEEELIESIVTVDSFLNLVYKKINNTK